MSALPRLRYTLGCRAPNTPKPAGAKIRVSTATPAMTHGTPVAHSCIISRYRLLRQRAESPRTVTPLPGPRLHRADAAVLAPERTQGGPVFSSRYQRRLTRPRPTRPRHRAALGSAGFALWGAASFLVQGLATRSWSLAGQEGRGRAAGAVTAPCPTAPHPVVGAKRRTQTQSRAVPN